MSLKPSFFPTLALCLCTGLWAVAQEPDSTAQVRPLSANVVPEPESKSNSFLDEASGSVFLTNNGISLVPSFSLGEPAAMALLTFRRKRFSVEPDIRFSLEGKPWTTLFWFRYRAVEKERFSLRVGAHPAINFITLTAVTDGVEKELISARRFLAGEIAPSYQLSQKVRLGAYYLTSWGFDETAKRIHFLTLNATLSDLNLSRKLYLVLSPQVFYLKQDDLDGYYANLTADLSLRGFPFSLQTILNKALSTRVQPEDDFIWNVSLVYSF